MTTRLAYYPSLVVNFKLRFDEALTNVVYKTTAIQKTGEDPQPSFEKLVTSDNLSQVMGLVPRQATIELPGYRTAGTFNLELAYKDFPLDPRVLRACAVEIHLGAVTAENFGKGMVQTKAGLRSSILNTRTEGGGVREDTLLMLGTVDDIGSSHGTAGSSVTLQGRDLRGILLDAPMTAGMLAQVKLDKPINEVVTQILNLHPLLKIQLDAKLFTVEIDKSEWEDGVLPVAPADLVTRVNKTADGSKAGLDAKGDSDKGSFWDLITQFCFVVGVVPWFKGTKLLLSRARSLYDQARAGQPGNPTPFADGLVRTLTIVKNGQQTTEDIRLRRLVYGGDILEFKLDRKLGGRKVPKVMCVSTNTSSDQRGFKARTLTGEWPEEGKGAATNVSPTGDAAEEETIRVPISGIADEKRLKEIARDIYNEIGRGELGGSISTKNLASFGGDNQDPDLLWLRPGDAVEVVTSATATVGARPPIVSELTSHNSTSQQEEEDALTRRLGDRNLARVLVATARNSVQELQRIFRVKDVKFGWSATGVTIDFDFHNFVESRYDQKG